MTWDNNLDKKSAVYKLVTSDSRVIRSVAGPGSGKSFAIRKRIIRLLENGTNPEKILAITFTRTSAADLRKEIANIGINGCEKITARTVHSHALSIVHQSEIRTIISRNPRMVIEHEIAPALRDIEFPKNSSINERKKMFESYESAWANLQSDEPGLPQNETEGEFLQRIRDWLKYHQGMMVGEVIPIALNYLQANPASPEIGKYDVVLIDEYQDLNRAEQEFVKIITGKNNVVIVGDDDQSIYGFKNAHPEGIREVGVLYGQFDDIQFDTIRRCPKFITRLASALISKNTHRTLGELKSYEKNQEGIVQLVQWPNNNQEIEGIVEIIKKEINNNLVKPEDVLVLSPRKLFGYRIRDMLLTNNIPAKSYFREDTIKNKNVQRAYSLLYLLAFPYDKISLRYLLGYGSSDYRLNQYKTIKGYADKNNVVIRDVLDNVLNNRLKITGISSLLNEYRKILIDLAILRRRLLEDADNFFEYFQKDGDNSDFDEITSLFQNILSDNPLESSENEDTIEHWIKSIVLTLTDSIAMPDSPENIDHVRIMSLHSSKGLSAKFVIMVSMIDELMPFISEDDERTDTDIIEEQRRLFYVAMTRCKSSENDYQGRLIISSFIWLSGIDALRIGIKATPKNQRKVQSSRFVEDFGRIRPQTILGSSLQSLGLK
jgi:superfamily I DNA/RNA helicase